MQLYADKVINTLGEYKVQNFIKLAKYLANIKPDYKHFNMKTFFSSTAEPRHTNLYDIHLPQPKCGSVACALGHGPAAGIMPDQTLAQRLFNSTGELCDHFAWDDYCCSYFVETNTTDFDCQQIWLWCFGADWYYYDNTPQGAAKRIMYMLTNGIPDVFDSRNEYIQYEHCLKFYQTWDISYDISK